MNIKIEFKDGDQSHVRDVKFPNIGQMMEIDRLKLLMTGGRYALMEANFSMPLMRAQIELVDAVATFYTLISDFKSMFKLDDVTKVLDWEISDPKVDIIITAYNTYYTPKLNEVIRKVSAVKVNEAIGATGEQQ